MDELKGDWKAHSALPRGMGMRRQLLARPETSSSATPAIASVFTILVSCAKG